MTAEVHGSEVYDVEIRTDGRHLRVWCSCPYFADRASGCNTCALSPRTILMFTPGSR